MFGVSSLSVSATETVNNLEINMSLYHGNSLFLETGYIANGESVDKKKQFSTSSVSYFTESFTIMSSDLSVIVPANREMMIEIPLVGSYLENINNGDRYGPGRYPTNPAFTVVGYDIQGNSYTLDSHTEGKNRETYYYGLVIDCAPVDADIVKFKITSPHFTYKDYFGNGVTGTYIRHIGFNAASNTTVTISSEEAGLLKKLINKIIELPSALSDMLKNFFLPDEQFIASYKAKFETLLSEHFGALYQSIDAFKSLDDAFSSAVTTQDSIQMPIVTVSLAGTDYSFGGYTVKMIPDKIVPIVNILKTLLGIVATLLFVNMLKHRYEGVVSK